MLALTDFTPKTLREDQDIAIEMLRDEFAQGRRRIMMQAPTGFGKTLVASALVKNSIQKNKRVIFTVPAIDLVDQTVENFYNEGIRDVGVMQADHLMTNWDMPVQVCSVQTLQRRKIPKSDLVIVDEAHIWFKLFPKWMMAEDGFEEWKGTPFIGLSATPWTAGLGGYYESLVIAETTSNLIKRGLLSPFKVYAPSSPDLTGVRTVAGDYHEGELSQAMNKSKLVGDVVDTWIQLGENRPTLCFAVDRAHGKNLQERFLQAGIAAAYQDADTPRNERRELKRKFHSDEIKVVVSIGTMIIGVDWDVRCIIWARPTKSETLFVQGTGRGLRTAYGKTDCLILDHADNNMKLGFVSDILHDTLSTSKTRVSSNDDRKVELPKKCPSCTYMKPPRMAKCPACGFVTTVINKVTEGEGALAEMKEGPKGSKAAKKFPDRHQTYGMLAYYCAARGYKPGWASNKYKDLYGVWPVGHKDAPQISPSYELQSWIKSTQVRWIKGKAKADHVAHADRPQGALTDRENSYITAVRERAAESLMTDQDWRDFR